MRFQTIEIKGNKIYSQSKLHYIQKKGQNQDKSHLKMIHCPFYRAHKKCVWYIFSYIYVFFPKWQSKKPKTSSYCFSPSKSKRFSSIRKPFATWLESIMESLISLDSCLNNYPWGKDSGFWSTICLSNEHSLLFQMCSRALELVGEQCVKIKLWHSNCTILF